MGEGTAERIEAGVDRIAAALFALAAGYAAYSFAGFFHASAPIACASVSIVGYGAAASLLRRLKARQPIFEMAFEGALLPDFEPELEELLLTQCTELLLTDADRLSPSQSDGADELQSNEADELVLDDILAKMGPGARVVRLFDPAAMPTPAQLKSRIDRHLHGDKAPSPPDASQALHQALAELRRSLG